jgi:hypothetical protein
MWQSVSSAPFDQDLGLAVIDYDGPHPLVFPCRRVLSGWIDADTSRRVDVTLGSSFVLSAIFWVRMVQHGEPCLFLSKKAGQYLTLRLIGLDGELPAEVLDVCSGDELVHEERASNAPRLRPHSDQGGH